MVTISKKFHAYCDKARELALTSCMTFKHSTLVIYKSSIISVGVNTNSRCYVRGNVVPSMHSEIQAVLTLTNRIRRKPLIVDLFVGRFTQDMKPRMSRPCNLCLKILAEMDNIEIRKIYYFNEYSRLVSENFRSMKKIYVSNGCRNFNISV